jgi:hypothetical protein
MTTMALRRRPTCPVTPSPRQRAQQLRDPLVEPRGHDKRHEARVRGVDPFWCVAEVGEEVPVGEAELVQLGLDGHVPVEHARRAVVLIGDGGKGVPEAPGAVSTRGVRPAEQMFKNPLKPEITSSRPMDFSLWSKSDALHTEAAKNNWLYSYITDRKNYKMWNRKSLLLPLIAPT